MRIAITGKIGSGKSEVLKILRLKGYKTFSADEIYKSLLLDEEFVREISEKMGTAPIFCDGKLTIDRKAISRLVFSDKDKLKLLNSVTHPKIMDELLRQTEGLSLCFCEIPLLAEVENYSDYFERVIEVVRPEAEVIKGVEKRDGLGEEQIKARLDNQKKLVLNQKAEHTFIYNDKTLSDLLEKVEALEKTF